jgi:flagellar biosynthesis protein
MREHEPRRRAVALSYESRVDVASQVRAAGSGLVGDRILAAAREAGIPIREDPDLAEALAVLDLGAAIPPELYGVIAEVLAWAYRANADYRRLRTG